MQRCSLRDCVLLRRESDHVPFFALRRAIIDDGSVLSCLWHENALFAIPVQSLAIQIPKQLLTPNEMTLCAQNPHCCPAPPSACESPFEHRVGLRDLVKVQRRALAYELDRACLRARFVVNSVKMYHLGRSYRGSIGCHTCDTDSEPQCVLRGCYRQRFWMEVGCQLDQWGIAKVVLARCADLCSRVKQR